MAKKKTANYFITFEAETDDPDIQSILDYFCDLKGQKNEAEYLDSDEFQIGYKKYLETANQDLFRWVLGAEKRKSRDGSNLSWKRKFSGSWNRAYKRRWTQPLMRYSKAGTKNKISGFSSDI